VVLEKLPQTVAGKIDRRALPLPPTPESKNGLSRGQRPRDVIETRLARIWESVLNLSPIGRNDDYLNWVERLCNRWKCCCTSRNCSAFYCRLDFGGTQHH